LWRLSLKYTELYRNKKYAHKINPHTGAKN